MKMLKNLTSTHKLTLWCVQCLVVIGLFLLLLIKAPISLNANLTSLFSPNTDDTWQSIKAKINASSNTTQLYLIGHNNLSTAQSASKKFVEHVNNIKGIDSVVARLSKVPDQSMMIESFKGYEQQLITPELRSALESGDTENIFKMEFELINQIGDQLVAKTIQADPTLSFAQYLNRSPFPQNKINMSHDGYLTIAHNDKTYVMITIQTLEGALNVNTAKAIVADLNLIPLDPNVEYIRTGAIFYSDEASRTAQTEMQWLGSLSIVATLLLIFLSYRRVSAVITTLSLIAISVFYGFVGLNLFFSEVNLLTMVFAVTLIGVAVDYSFHSFTELQRVDNCTLSPLSTIKISLVLSFITTTIGYSLLVVVPVILFKQIAVFTIFGLLGALLTVLLVYPYLHQKFNFHQDKPPLFYQAVNRIHKSFCTLNQLKVFLLCMSFIGMIACLLHVQFIDNPKSFYRVSDSLMNSEKQVKAILGQKFDNQYLLIRGDTPQQLLETEEKVLPILNQLTFKKIIGSYQAITQWLPSIKQQQVNNQLLIEAANQKHFNQLSNLLGMNINNVVATNNYLTPAEWFQSPFGQMFNRLWHEQNSTYYSVIRFAGITDVDVLSLALSSINNTEYIDTLAETEKQLVDFRQVLLIVFGVAFISAFFVFTLRYGWKKAIIGVLVPVSAFAFALVISSFIQDQINLFNVAAGLVILALGLDYSVFYAEHGFSESITQTTLMSALSSIFVFALLGFSSTPAIASFGQTVFIGIVITFLCSPLITKTPNKRGQDD